MTVELQGIRWIGQHCLTATAEIGLEKVPCPNELPQLQYLFGKAFCTGVPVPWDRGLPLADGSGRGVRLSPEMQQVLLTLGCQGATALPCFTRESVADGKHLMGEQIKAEEGIMESGPEKGLIRLLPWGVVF